MRQSCRYSSLGQKGGPRGLVGPKQVPLPALSLWEHLFGVPRAPGCWDPRPSDGKTSDPSGEQVPGCSRHFVYSDAADGPRLGRRGSARFYSRVWPARGC